MIFLLDPRLWYMGGGCGHSRYFSRFVALQIKAALLGMPLRVFKGSPVVRESEVLDV